MVIDQTWEIQSMKKVEGNGSILEPQRRSFFRRSGAREEPADA
jgi:hypothetical protein